MRACAAVPQHVASAPLIPHAGLPTIGAAVTLSQLGLTISVVLSLLAPSPILTTAAAPKPHSVPCGSKCVTCTSLRPSTTIHVSNALFPLGPTPAGVSAARHPSRITPHASPHYRITLRPMAPSQSCQRPRSQAPAPTPPPIRTPLPFTLSLSLSPALPPTPLPPARPLRDHRSLPYHP